MFHGANITLGGVKRFSKLSLGRRQGRVHQGQGLCLWRLVQNQPRQSCYWLTAGAILIRMRQRVTGWAYDLVRVVTGAGNFNKLRISWQDLRGVGFGGRGTTMCLSNHSCSPFIESLSRINLFTFCCPMKYPSLCFLTLEYSMTSQTKMTRLWCR